MHAVRRVAVIGAGAAGLASARQLDRVGIDVAVFEATPELGGTWVYTDEVESDPLGATPEPGRIHTSMYAALRTNLPRDLMAFREFPFDGRGGGDDGWLRFPTHEQVLLYLGRYAEHFGLLSKIRFEARVTLVRPVRSDGSAWLVADREEPAGWVVRFQSAAGEAQDERFDAVIVCNGHYAHARVPALEGMSGFSGEMLHSHSYRRAESVAGKRVVLLGARASGIDIALEIAEHARAVFLCAREVKGRQPLGMDGDAELRPAIRALGPGGRVTLTDGTTLEDVDALVFCTGYEYRLPFFEVEPEDHRAVLVDDNWVHPLYLDLIAARATTLGLVGLANRIVPFPQFELQARVLARVYIREVALPPRDEREQSAAARARELREAGVEQRHFHLQGDRQFAYNHELARLGGVDPLPPEFEQVFRATEAARLRDPRGYRDEPLPWVDAVSERRAGLARR